MPVAEERALTKALAEVCLCESCKKGRKEAHNIHSERINGYSSIPDGGWEKQGEGDVYLGVELETMVTREGDDGLVDYGALHRASSEFFPFDEPEPHFREWVVTQYQRPIDVWYIEAYDPDGCYSRWEREVYLPWRLRYNEVRSERDAWYVATAEIVREEARAKQKNRWQPDPITAEEAVSLAEPRYMWHAKHDGSVTGPEFASLPASLEHWYSIRPELESMFTALLHGGLRSYAGDQAGMHISISVESFRDSDHLVRFANLINNNPRWSKRMSQRTNASMSWCRLQYGVFGRGERSVRSWADEVMMYGHSDAGDRYVALNADTHGQGRIEFRLPRGTLRIDRFFKNLEWVASMIEFTRNYEPTDAASYMRWVMASGRFASLQAWLTEKYGLTPVQTYEPKAAVTTRGNVRRSYRSARVTMGMDDDYDDDIGFYEDDSDENEYICDCGLTHDMPFEMYTPTTDSIRHFHVSGRWLPTREEVDRLELTAQRIRDVLSGSLLDAITEAGPPIATPEETTV